MSVDYAKQPIVPKPLSRRSWDRRGATQRSDAIRGDVMAMRADALARLGADGLGCTITYSEANRGGQIWRYVEGTFTAPLYMTSQNPPALLVRDGDGKPVFQRMVQVPFVADGLPGGSGPKQIVSIVAENDAQVPPVTADLAARTAGLTTIRGSARAPWGLAVADAPFAGSAFVSMNWGDGPVPYGNVPPAHDDGGHGSVPFTDASLTIAQHFLETGVVTMPCSGVCDPG